ncbi:MAG TPA: glycosyltransferase family 4 protein, partial [Planctomycetaceae bacterium]|nr:glycosyltransferase family 4 protein [Planctomycetaceae bacterium]
MPTKLCYITTHAMSAEFLMRGQLAFLGEQGFDLTLIASPHDSLSAVAEREGANVVPIPMEREISPLRDLKALWQLCVTLRQLRPDIVNAGTPKAGLLGNLAAWMCRVPVRIYTLRGLRLETATGLKERLLNWTEKLASACAHQVIAVGHSLRDAYVARGLTSPDKTTVLRHGSSNGVAFERFQFDSAQWRQIAELRESWNIPADAPVIGFVGRLTRDKGIPELFAAFERLRPEFPEARLMLVGEAEHGDPLPDELLGQLQAHPNVVLTGPIQEVASYYGVFDLLAFPSYREGFPNVPLEAASAGLAVVGFRATGTIDAVVDGSTGTLVEIGDVAGL